jgi:hypothetical protein
VCAHVCVRVRVWGRGRGLGRGAVLLERDRMGRGAEVREVEQGVVEAAWCAK